MTRIKVEYHIISNLFDMLCYFSHTQANEGDLNLVLEVSVRAYPAPKVTWYLDDLEITEKRTEFERIEEIKDGSYKLKVKEVTSEIKGK